MATSVILTTSPPMLGCLKMYILCTGRGRWNPRLRQTAETAGERVNDLWTDQVTHGRVAIRQHGLASCRTKSKACGKVHTQWGSCRNCCPHPVCNTAPELPLITPFLTLSLLAGFLTCLGCCSASTCCLLPRTDELAAAATYGLQDLVLALT